MGAGRQTGVEAAFAGRDGVYLHSWGACLCVFQLSGSYVGKRSGGLESQHGHFVAAVLDLLFFFDLRSGSFSGLCKKEEYGTGGENMKEKREFSPLMMLLAMLLLLCILFLYGLVQSGEKEKAIQEKELALSNVELDYREILISEWNGRYRYAVSEQGDQIYISGISSGEDGYSDPGDLSRSSVQLESEDIFSIIMEIP